MSARKPDAFMDPDNLQCVHRTMLTWAREQRCTVPLYALSIDDLNAIRWAAEWIDPDEGGEAEEDQLRALAAALRSITDERKV